MRYATFISALIHVGFLAAGFIVAPFMYVPPAEYRAVVPVELISEAEFSELLSVRADQRSEEVAEDPAPQQPDPEPSRPEPEPEPVIIPDPIVPDPEPEPEPEPVTPDPEPEVREEPPRREEPDEEDDFFSGLDDALVDLEEDNDRQAPAEVLDPEGLRDQEQIGLGDQLTASHIDMIRSRMEEQCYDQLTGVPNADEIVVRVRFNLDRNGNIEGQPTVLNARRIALSNNQWWRATRDRALRAVVDCQPYDYLPDDQYYLWSEITLNFRPIGVM